MVHEVITRVITSKKKVSDPNELGSLLKNQLHNTAISASICEQVCKVIDIKRTHKTVNPKQNTHTKHGLHKIQQNHPSYQLLLVCNIDDSDTYIRLNLK